MVVLSEATNSVRYIYDADVRKFEELHDADAVEEPAMEVDFLLCNPS